MAYNNNITQNIKVIKELLYTDLQRRLFRQYNERTQEFLLNDDDYDRACSALHIDIAKVHNMKDVNDLLVEYSDLFTTEYDELLVPTIEGTMNYVIDLLVKLCEIGKTFV